MAINQELYEHNLDFFKQLAPELGEILSTFEPEAELVTCPNGETDLSVSGNLVYGGGALTATTRQIEDPDWENSRIQLPPYSSDALDRVAGEFVGNFLNQASNEAGLAFFTDQLSRAPAAHAVVFGIGFGFHLDTIAATSQCRQLILVDSSHEFLFHSLRVYDWPAFFERHSNEGRIIRIVIGDDAAMQAMTIREYIREINVAGLEGTYIYHHYRSPGTDETEQLLLPSIQELHNGYSFFDLEMQRLSNGQTNLSRDNARVTAASEYANAMAACVVDGGQALSSTMDDLKKNRDKLFLIAVPSAVSPLLNAGLTPDMVCLMDDAQMDGKVLQQMKDTVLLSPVLVDPDVAGKFAANVYFFLGALATCALFGDEAATLRGTGGDPRLAAAAFAKSQGFATVTVIADDVSENDHDWSENPELPEGFVAGLLDNLPLYGADNVAEHIKQAELVAEMSSLRQEIMALAKSAETPEKWIESVVWLLLPIGGDERPRQILATSVARGSILMALFAAQGYLLRLRERDRFDELFKILLDPFDQMLNKMQDEAATAINVLRAR